MDERFVMVGGAGSGDADAFVAREVFAAADAAMSQTVAAGTVMAHTSAEMAQQQHRPHQDHHYTHHVQLPQYHFPESRPPPPPASGYEGGHDAEEIDMGLLAEYFQLDCFLGGGGAREVYRQHSERACPIPHAHFVYVSRTGRAAPGLHPLPLHAALLVHPDALNRHHHHSAAMGTGGGGIIERQQDAILLQTLRKVRDRIVRDHQRATVLIASILPTASASMYRGPVRRLPCCYQMCCMKEI